MLTTNEVETISEVGPLATNAVIELVSTIGPIILTTIVALWRRSASKSKLQTAIIDVLVRSIEKSKDQIGNDDTVIVKKTVQQEAQRAGIEKHVEKAVDKVTTKMAENGNESAHL